MAGVKHGILRLGVVVLVLHKVYKTHSVDRRIDTAAWGLLKWAQRRGRQDVTHALGSVKGRGGGC